MTEEEEKKNGKLSRYSDARTRFTIESIRQCNEFKTK